MKIDRFFASVYRDNRTRKKTVRNIRKDVLLYLFNTLLRPFERLALKLLPQGNYPLVFIVGVPRSGTTLLSQLAARYLKVAYINNWVARYWMAPVIGSMLYRRLFDPAKTEEMRLESSEGRTKGAASPHEFAWFWQYWSAWPEHDQLTPAEARAVNWAAIGTELNGVANYWRRPLILKSINYTDYQIGELYARFPNAHFIYIKRDPMYVAQSILEVRRGMYGDEKLWWSVKPADYADWLEKSPEEQVAHQINHISASIEQAFARLPQERRLTVDYEDMVANPQACLTRLAGFMATETVAPELLAKIAVGNKNEIRMEEKRKEKLKGLLHHG